MPVDPVEEALLQRLARLMRGEKGDPFNPFEGPPNFEEKQKAAEQYLRVKAAQEARIVREQDLALSSDKQQHEQRVKEAQLKLEADRVAIEGKKERDHADLEFAKLEIMKADVIVRAIEAAARNPEAAPLMNVAQELSRRLLQGGELPLLRIEEKKE